MKTLLTAAVALALSGAALAQTGAVTITSTAFVVKQVPDGQGKLKNTLAPPTSVIPGNALVFTLDYKNTGTMPATGFVINNPIPANVSFTGVEQPWAVVSVDGGKSFGPLATLKMPKGDGTMRAAVPQDVTAIRWVFARPILPAAGGKVAFYAVVK
jgi:uncharacterized repeat protein (TIGR01451 family)